MIILLPISDFKYNRYQISISSLSQCYNFCLIFLILPKLIDELPRHIYDLLYIFKKIVYLYLRNNR